MGTVETFSDIFSVLSHAGENNKPTADQLIRDVQTLGLDGFINKQAEKYPQVVSKIPNGARIDFGSGTTFRDGTVLSGVITATATNTTITSSQVRGTVNLTQNGFAKNGEAALVKNATVQVNLTTSSGHARGTLTLSGSGSSAAGTTTFSGTVEVDTERCARYPVGGSITVVRNGESKTITFNSKCDGTFGFSGELRRYNFELQIKDCEGKWLHPEETYALAAEGGKLFWNPNCPKSRWWRHISGTISETNAYLTFDIGGETSYRIQGTFTGTRQNPGYPVGWYSGPATYSFTRYNSNGEVICHVPAITVNDPTYRNTVFGGWPLQPGECP
jgi:hypothetical protein